MPEITIETQNLKVLDYYSQWSKQCAIENNVKRDIKIQFVTYTNAYPFSISRISETNNQLFEIKLFYEQEIV